MFLQETKGLSCVPPFLFGLCSLGVRLTTLPGGGAPLSWEQLRRQVREGGVGIIDQYN